MPGKSDLKTLMRDMSLAGSPIDMAGESMRRVVRWGTVKKRTCLLKASMVL